MLLRHSSRRIWIFLTWQSAAKGFSSHCHLLHYCSSRAFGSDQERVMETRRQNRTTRSEQDTRPYPKDTDSATTTRQKANKREAPAIKEEPEVSKSKRRSVDTTSNSDSDKKQQAASKRKRPPTYRSIEYEDTGTSEYDQKWSREYPHPLWKKHYNNIVKMREKETAPVDSMGCERLAEKEKSPKERRYHTLISLMLSSQTKVGTLRIFRLYYMLLSMQRSLFHCRMR
eukprot:gb/GECG01013554.1/.p1 GENE.gb/GECG01013554.1/~~gb/GECG01013554.1/.p1  ORF type:complete len:228 (+),score=23.52 gb/GECG01013554.1/:1-684(+)